MSYVIHAHKGGALLSYRAQTPDAALHKVRALRAVSLEAKVFTTGGDEVLETELERLIAARAEDED